jgi:hypothetical protein
MYYKKFTLGRGRSRIRIEASLTENGICILLTGGTNPHIGGMTLSNPRKSLSGESASADTWVVPISGHKDVVIAEKVGDLICRSINEPVSVSAGIHIDNALPEELDLLCLNSMKAAEKIIKWAQTLRSKA